MTEMISLYSIGDWVVHHSYGVGQIKKIEEKPIHGGLVACFRVKTKDGAYWWFPRNGADNPRIRPVASQNMLQRAQEEFQEPVRDLDPDRNMWKSRIDEVRAGDDLIAITQMVRDLTILQTQRKLNQTEVKALSYFKDHLLKEWSATMNIDVEDIRPKLNRYLQACRERASVQPG
jgi:RNA polymerase-interacting CarD/CdnL/TRCF family regulator